MTEQDKFEYKEFHYASGWLTEEIQHRGQEGWEYIRDLGGSTGLWQRRVRDV